MQDHVIKKTKMNRFNINLLLVLLVVVLTVAPLIIMKDAKFGGSDNAAEAAITGIQADYKPWFSPLFKPASSEMESLGFAIEAAIGAGIIGYGLGYLKGRNRGTGGDKNDQH